MSRIATGLGRKLVYEIRGLMTKLADFKRVVDSFDLADAITSRIFRGKPEDSIGLSDSAVATLACDGGCYTCDVCQNCDVCQAAEQCPTCDVCDTCQNCNTGCQLLCQTCATCDTCQQCYSACYSCNICQTCDDCDNCYTCQGSCQTCQTCVSCQFCYMYV